MGPLFVVFHGHDRTSSALSMGRSQGVPGLDRVGLRRRQPGLEHDFDDAARADGARASFTAPGRSGAFRAPRVMIPGLTSSGSRRSVAKRFGARSRRRLLIHCASFSGLGTFGLPIKPSTHYFRAYILPCNEIVALMFQAELTGMESPRRLGVVSPTKPCQGLRVSARTPETLRCVWRKPARCQRNATLSLS